MRRSTLSIVQSCGVSSEGYARVFHFVFQPLYANSRSRVLIYGDFSPQFMTRNGIRQCLSHFTFSFQFLQGDDYRGSYNFKWEYWHWCMLRHETGEWQPKPKCGGARITEKKLTEIEHCLWRQLKSRLSIVIVDNSKIRGVWFTVCSVVLYHLLTLVFQRNYFNVCS